ncbi:8935_t:CDS:2 [Paraglomus brasilianum]|uniref:8935_t:CDS:1 n=1 Tax=Paraglomus brasilianum TaxID=144538 RepID=A0A9N9FFL4_9GLOM|nr:8935_t:CDS:2 [Paraglomus brasilianum]
MTDDSRKSNLLLTGKLTSPRQFVRLNEVIVGYLKKKDIKHPTTFNQSPTHPHLHIKMAQSYKPLVYSTLKTLNEPNNTDGDFFKHADDEIYIPESFSCFFGDFISEEDIKDAIEQLQEEKSGEAKIEQKVEVKKEEGWFADVKKMFGMA